jgi:hypothetical protein
MGVREAKVENYFHEQVELCLAGTTRKAVSPAKSGFPDRIPIWPGCPFQVFVEVKTLDGKLSVVQQREHGRLIQSGALVFTVVGRAGVDEFIDAAMAKRLRIDHDHEKRVYK